MSDSSEKKTEENRIVRPRYRATDCLDGNLIIDSPRLNSKKRRLYNVDAIYGPYHSNLRPTGLEDKAYAKALKLESKQSKSNGNNDRNYNNHDNTVPPLQSQQLGYCRKNDKLTNAEYLKILEPILEEWNNFDFSFLPNGIVSKVEHLYINDDDTDSGGDDDNNMSVNDGYDEISINGLDQEEDDSNAPQDYSPRNLEDKNDSKNKAIIEYNIYNNHSYRIEPYIFFITKRSSNLTHEVPLTTLHKESYLNNIPDRYPIYIPFYVPQSHFSHSRSRSYLAQCSSVKSVTTRQCVHTARENKQIDNEALTDDSHSNTDNNTDNNNQRYIDYTRPWLYYIDKQPQLRIYKRIIPNEHYYKRDNIPPYTIYPHNESILSFKEEKEILKNKELFIENNNGAIPRSNYIYYQTYIDNDDITINDYDYTNIIYYIDNLRKYDQDKLEDIMMNVYPCDKYYYHYTYYTIYKALSPYDMYIYMKPYWDQYQQNNICLLKNYNDIGSNNNTNNNNNLYNDDDVLMMNNAHIKPYDNDSNNKNIKIPSNDNTDGSDSNDNLHSSDDDATNTLPYNLPVPHRSPQSVKSQSSTREYSPSLSFMKDTVVKTRITRNDRSTSPLSSTIAEKTPDNIDNNPSPSGPLPPSKPSPYDESDIKQKKKSSPLMARSFHLVKPHNSETIQDPGKSQGRSNAKRK